MAIRQDVKVDGTFDAEIQIDLGETRYIASAFIINFYNYWSSSLRIGNCYIYVGDDGTPFSNNLKLGTTQPINEGGFIELDTVLSGRYFVLRRVGPGLPNRDSNLFVMSEIKVYASVNLLQYSASIFTSPAAHSDD